VETAIPQQIRVFDKTGWLIVDSQNIEGVELKPLFPENKPPFRSVEVLKQMAATVLKALPGRRSLPLYPANPEAQDARAYPDAPDALKGTYSLTAWNDEQGFVFLSGAAPLDKDGLLGGAVLLT